MSPHGDPPCDAEMSGKQSEITEIAQYYDSDTLLEWLRLERHRMEFAVTMRALADYLPEPPAAILDIGGGPGRYVIALAERGYRVTLVDLAQRNLDFARQKAAEHRVQLIDYVHGNALDLKTFPTDTFDAVLLMGPLYHLLEREQRVQAVYEACRVLKPTGVLCAAFITRYSPIRDLAHRVPMQFVQERERWEEIIRTGVYRASPSLGFTNAYFAHPLEITPLMEQAGLETLDLIGVEGAVSRIEEKVNELTGEDWQAWVELNYRLGRDPVMHGAADHLLYVGRK